MVSVTMSRLTQVMLLVLVLALLVVGLPVGMPMGEAAMCPQCVLPAGLACALAAMLGLWLPTSNRAGGRVPGASVRLRGRLWACSIDHPPQAPPLVAVR
jgi:hypothetical protein